MPWSYAQKWWMSKGEERAYPAEQAKEIRQGYTMSINGIALPPIEASASYSDVLSELVRQSDRQSRWTRSSTRLSSLSVEITLTSTAGAATMLKNPAQHAQWARTFTA